MNVRKIIFFFSVLVSFLLLFGYPFFKISYAFYFEPNSGPPDIISMLPLSYWLFTALVLSFVIIQIVFAKSKFEVKLEKLFLTIFVPWMMYGSLPISQFPSIYSINDAVVHLADAENVILNGGVHHPAVGYLQFPGTSYMVAIIGKLIGVTGGVSLFELGVILNTIFVLLISLFLLVIGQRILGSRNGFILPILFFLTNTDFFTHFCEFNFAFVFYFLGIVVFLSLGENSKSRSVTGILVLISAVITMTHPIMSVFMIATFFGIYLGQKLFKNKIGITISIKFLLCTVGILITWWVFFATENFQALINSFYTLIQIGIHSPTQVFLQPLHSSYSQYLSFFTKVFQFFVGGTAVVGLILIWFRRKTKTVPLVLFEFLIGLLIVGVFPFVLFHGDWADRSIQLALFPICALAIYGLETISSVLSKKIQFVKHLRTFGLCLIIMILPFAFIYHHQLDSTLNVLSSDFSTSGFLLKFSPSVPIAFPWTIGGYATYYYQDPTIMDIQMSHSPSTLLTPYVFLAWLNNPQVIVFSLKEIRYFEYTGTVYNDYNQRLSYLNASAPLDRVYDNLFNTVYV